MKILNFLFVAVLFGVSALNLHALQIATTITNPNNFGIKFPNGSQFYGNANKVVSISKQEFIVGPLLVTEVCIEFDQSPLQVRIYNSQTIPAGKVLNDANNKVPERLSHLASNPNLVKSAEKIDKQLGKTATQQNVYKDYPTTTHARTIEFIVPNLNELNDFFEKISNDFNKMGNQSMNKKIYILTE